MRCVIVGRVAASIVSIGNHHCTINKLFGLCCRQAVGHNLATYPELTVYSLSAYGFFMGKPLNCHKLHETLEKILSRGNLSDWVGHNKMPAL